MAWDDYQPKEVRALHGISNRSAKPDRNFEKNLVNLNQSVKYMSQMMGIMQGGIDDANKDILQNIKDAIDDLIIIFGGGGDTLNFDWGDLEIIGKNLGSILGLDFLKMPVIDLPAWASHFFDTFLAPLSALGDKIDDVVHGLFEILFGWLDDVPFIGDFIRSIGEAINATRAVADDAIDGIDAVQGQVQTIQNLVFIRSGRPLWEGIDPTGESTFPFFGMLERVWGNSSNNTGSPIHNHGSGDYKIRCDYLVNSANSRLGYVRHGYDGMRTQISFIGRRQTTGAVYLDIYRFKEDYTSEVIWSSANLDSSFSTNNRWVQIDIPDTLLALGDVTFAHIRAPSGAYYVTGADLFVPEASALIPYRPLALGGNRSASTAPSTFTAADADAWVSQETPFFQFGSYDANITAPRRFFDNFNRTGSGAGDMGNSNYQIFSVGVAGNSCNMGVNGSVATLQGVGQIITLHSSAQLIYPLATLEFISEADFAVLSSDTNRRAGIYAHSASDATGRVEMLLGTDVCAIVTRASESAAHVVRTSQTGMSGNNTHWKFTYTESDKTYRVFKGSNTTPEITWPDPTNIAGRADHKKYGAIFTWHSGFTGTATIDNWDYRDSAYA